MRNSVMLIGRPGAEPETRTFNDNRIVTRFNLAVNEMRRNANHQQVKDTQWFTVVAWDKTAERVAQVVKKGKRIAIDGALRNNEWTDKNGQRHLSTEIHLNNFILLDWGKEQNSETSDTRLRDEESSKSRSPEVPKSKNQLLFTNKHTKP